MYLGALVVAIGVVTALSRPGHKKLSEPALALSNESRRSPSAMPRSPQCLAAVSNK